MISKIKNLFKKTEKIIWNKSEITYSQMTKPTSEFTYLDFKYEEPSVMPNEMKIAAQKIGLDLVELNKNSNIEMTSGYYDFKPEVNYDEIIFQMNKIKRASEKVLDRMIETEKAFNKSLNK